MQTDDDKSDECPARSSAADDNFETLLATAAGAAAEKGLSFEAFMNAAFQAYVAAHPQMIEHMQNVQLVNQLHALRMQGRLAVA